MRNFWRWRRRLSDLNIRRDPAAARAVLGAYRDVRLFPLDVVERLMLDRTRLTRIGASSAVGRYLQRHSERWLAGAWLRHGRAAFPVWDLVATLAAIDALPDAQFDASQRLVRFDAQAAWGHVESIIAGRRALL